jgi:MFS superfamily sulfate permease-like transporter
MKRIQRGPVHGVSFKLQEVKAFKVFATSPDVSTGPVAIMSMVVAQIIQTVDKLMVSPSFAPPSKFLLTGFGQHAYFFHQRSAIPLFSPFLQLLPGCITVIDRSTENTTSKFC